MYGVNKVFLIGQVSDNEVRFNMLASGNAVCNFTLVINESYDYNGEMKDRKSWQRIVVWNKEAEKLDGKLCEGQWVCIEGKVQNSSWVDKEGTKRYKTEINATGVVLIATDSQEKYDQPAQYEIPNPDQDDSDEDLPF